MKIDQIGQVVTQQAVQAQGAQAAAQTPQQPVKAPPVINSNEIRAILYLGIRGKISLPVNNHKVDVLA